MNIKTTELVSLASTAAEAFNDYDIAQTQLGQSFGVPYEAAKDNLLRDVTLADKQGMDLSVFSGSNSRFKFPDFNTNIVVRIYKKPSPHVRLDKLAEKVKRLERDLKLAKTELKHAAEQLVIAGECDELTERIVLSFTRMPR